MSADGDRTDEGSTPSVDVSEPDILGEGELVVAGDESPRADHDFVTLQPLTLELVALQLDRLDVRFNREPDRVRARWETFSLTIRVLDKDQLTVRATFDRRYPAPELVSLVGKCNQWNSTRTFLKASATVITHQVEPSPSDVTPGKSVVALASVCLDQDLPCGVGIAPVQLQALFRAMLSNIELFKEVTGIGVPAPDVG